MTKKHAVVLHALHVRFSVFSTFRSLSRFFHDVREHSFFRRGVGRRNSGEGQQILPAQKERVSINLTQQRGGLL